MDCQRANIKNTGKQKLPVEPFVFLLWLCQWDSIKKPNITTKTIYFISSLKHLSGHKWSVMIKLLYINGKSTKLLIELLTGCRKKNFSF